MLSVLVPTSSTAALYPLIELHDYSVSDLSDFKRSDASSSEGEPCSPCPWRTQHARALAYHGRATCALRRERMSTDSVVATVDAARGAVLMRQASQSVMSMLRRNSSSAGFPVERPVMKGRTLAVACGVFAAAVGVALLRRWQRKSRHALPRRRLGNKTGLQVTVVSLGGVGLGGKGPDDLYGGITDEEAIATVHRAVARGINFIDTSPLYRESERRIGLALESLSELDRSRVHVGTKVGDDCPPFSDNGGFSPFSYDGVMCSIRHSLKQLRVVKRLETVLLHDPTLAEVRPRRRQKAVLHRASAVECSCGWLDTPHSPHTAVDWPRAWWDTRQRVGHAATAGAHGNGWDTRRRC